MAYQEPSHNPATGVVAPSTWGDQVNDNFSSLNGMPKISLFPISSGEVPLSLLQGAAYSVVQSSTGGTPKPQFPILSFDAGTDEGRMWNREAGRVVGGTLILSGAFYMASATTGSVVLGAQISAVSDGDGTVTAKAFAAVNGGTIAVPGAAGTEKAFAISLAVNDSLTALDRFCVVLYRDADNGSDNATGDMNLTRLNLNYSLGA